MHILHLFSHSIGHITLEIQKSEENRMAVKQLLTLSAIIFAAYITRHSAGIPLPFKMDCGDGERCWKRIDLWGYVITDGQPNLLNDLLIENLSVWLVAYSVVHFLTHVRPQRQLFHPFKFNPNYPRYHSIIMATCAQFFM